MPNFKGRTINNQNSSVLTRAAEQLPDTIIGPQSGLVKTDLIQYSKKIARCSKTVVAAHHETGSKILEVNRCGIHKICPVCADAVSGKRIRHIDSLLSENWDSAKYAYMLTFTIKDGHDLNERMQVLTAGYRAWYLKGRKRENGFSLGESSKIQGSTKSIEIKIGENSGVWHPHIHCIVFANEKLDYAVYNESVKKQFLEQYGKTDKVFFNRFMEQNNGFLYPWENESGIVPLSKLSKEWREATNGEGLSIRADLIYSPETRPQKYPPMFFINGEAGEHDKKSEVLKSVKYSLKYSVKAGDFGRMTPAQVFELFDVMKLHRSIEYSGFLRKKAEKVEPVHTCQTFSEFAAVQFEEVKREIALQVPESGKEGERKARRRELLEFCRESEISTYTSPDTKTDGEISTYLGKVKEYVNQPEIEHSGLVREMLEMKLLSGDFTRTEQKRITQKLYGVPEPEEVKDEPTESRAGKYAAEYFRFDPDRIGDSPLFPALYQLGADFHTDYKITIAREGARSRKTRNLFFWMWKEKYVSDSEYLSTVDAIKERLKMKISLARSERNERINTRSGGLFMECLSKKDMFETQNRVSAALGKVSGKGIPLDDFEKWHKIKNESKVVFGDFLSKGIF